MRGNYDDVNRRCTQLCEDRRWAFVNVNLRPYYAEGSKTLAYETVEQLGWAPDRVVVPIASGSLFTKVARGFSEQADGLVEGELPASTAPRRRAARPWPPPTPRAGTRRLQKPDTIAKSLAIGNPPTAPTRSSWHGGRVARSIR